MFNKVDKIAQKRAWRFLRSRLNRNCEEISSQKQEWMNHVKFLMDFLRTLVSMNVNINPELEVLASELHLLTTGSEVDVVDNLAVQVAAQDLMFRTLHPEDRFLAPELIRRERPPLNTSTYQNEVMKWDIQPGEKVLDVGSGGWPFKLATHLADMYPGNTTHRFDQLKRDERPFYVVDINNLPFVDKTWDFVFCSHVLEHVDKPGTAIRELQRIGKRGYIEMPSRLSDFMLNFTRLKDHHRWHGLRLGDTLAFIEWDESERRDIGTNHFFNLLHSSYHNEFQEMFERNWDLFFCMMRWQDTIPFIVINRKGKIVDRSNDMGR